ncbi:MAG TPA: tetraacyldisaccharide 4'-kinase, partial [Longimicrobiales bacterium]|nr:tetraacyldisaccharide 4'-kinase [Longimicrobiales bacterium]
GATLPAGPYRERPEALARADVVVLTRRRAPAEAALALAAAARRYAPGARLAGLALVPGGWRDLEGAPREPPAGPVLAACAVARPDAFAAAVRARVGGEVELAAFADHHPFGRADARRLRARARGRPVVLTEKDAVKLAPHADALGPAWVLADALRWEWGEDEVREALASVLAGASAR